MTWEPDTSADLEEKIVVAAATNLGDIRAVTWAEVREHTLRDENLQNLPKKIEDLGLGILPIQGWTQHNRWSDFIQQQDCYPITTKSTNPRHTAFCSSRCLLHDVQG